MTWNIYGIMEVKHGNTNINDLGFHNFFLDILLLISVIKIPPIIVLINYITIITKFILLSILCKLNRVNYL